MRLDLPASRLLRVLLWSVAAIHLLSLGFTIVYHGFGVYDLIPYWGRIVKFFYVDKEQNLPTWFSSGLLFLAALLLWQLGGADRASGGRFHRHWRVLAAVFTGLSLDEFSQFHELGAQADVLDAGRASYLSWLVLAAPLVLVLALSYLRLLLALPPRVRWLMLGAAALFLGGAAGIEVLGAYTGRENIGFTPGWASMRYVLAASAEELCEMLGVVLFIYAAALHLQHPPSTPATPTRPSPRRPTVPKEGRAPSYRYR
ncbi:hypothetical protein [Catellatospora citrea]|uniref:Uncharacterized protein n=1 Tax=Catellatospora citrea TaxID=53366 RepID=A0A8J3P3K7_9ACTN|nr:hypothetical protein [Catellatospora citrea]RKE09857.1 hypothetical protein C8E86_4748 [Catellatospora citrea]GIG02731.1 hypothetical protein Cci01nite_78240 [Catellatospora citrea]